MNRRDFLTTGSEGPRKAIHKRYFPDIVMQTHQGKSVRLYEDLIKDRIVTLNFMYLACSDGTCPVTTHNLSRVQKILKARIGRDIFMYSITLDPEYDTPELLAAYAKSFDAGPGWLFLRAAPADTERLRRKLGFYDRDPATDAQKSSHAAMVRYGNEPRMLWSSTAAMLDPEVTAKSILWVANPSS